jgi:hypothetical protein
MGTDCSQMKLKNFTMAKHTVLFELPKKEIGKVDANFFIQKDGAMLGKIKISKGGLDYFPANRQIPIKITWTQFDKLIKEWSIK